MKVGLLERAEFIEQSREAVKLEYAAKMWFAYYDKSCDSHLFGG
ncbi:hypothetical protein SAMN02745166_04608 [Prosthecobacter debontii]|uniref:Uncharacterized protein n=1 Tax=Prosthecobacter debontii TaxID=48467 RepID=A0A1T4YZK0_9BACT|nr:hypothetical protein SAMN02745166_04608 [Prosthecobacter debontii]